MALLKDEQIDQELSRVQDWAREGDRIVRNFEFEDFVAAVKFVDGLVEPSERLGHHPDLAISWNKVEVGIFDHAEGGITSKDFRLAAEIDKLA
ncbi:MAG: 4a-hydroxytetrahydrobiopterin dehydratase [Actinomycetota bacterium]|nr:4a-hydroxytetrahydrobiopterin dehydratase [Actinomycetota bacterium]